MSEEQLPPLPKFDLMHYTPYRLAVAAQKLSEALEQQYKKEIWNIDPRMARHCSCHLLGWRIGPRY